MKTQVDYEIALEAQREMFMTKNKLQLAEIFDNIDLDQDGYLEFYEVSNLKKNIIIKTISFF